MAYVKKSWRGKLLDDKDLPRVFDTRKGKMSQRWGEGLCAIPRPRDVDALMKNVPKGKRLLVVDFETRISRTKTIRGNL